MYVCMYALKTSKIVVNKMHANNVSSNHAVSSGFAWR